MRENILTSIVFIAFILITVFITLDLIFVIRSTSYINTNNIVEITGGDS